MTEEEIKENYTLLQNVLIYYWCLQKKKPCKFC